MAHLLGTQNVGALAGSRKLLEGVTVGLDDGSRVASPGRVSSSKGSRSASTTAAASASSDPTAPESPRSCASWPARRNPTGEW